MAKPRIFVSSTYYDLRHIRKNLDSFIKEMGYEPVLFEGGNIPFMHDKTLDESCYAEIENAHMQILIIGGRYGNPTSEDKTKVEKDKGSYEKYNSITKKEYEKALEKKIPIFIFVDKGVHAEYETFKKNRNNEDIKYAHVDSINIFRLLDDILIVQSGTYVKEFDNFDDIKNWLKEQWAGLFADFLSRKNSETNILTLSSQIDELKNTSDALKEYTKAIMESVRPKDSGKIIKEEEAKLKEIRKVSAIQKLNNEPMMNYIKRSYRLMSDSPEKIFEEFNRSKTITSFIKKILHEEDARRFLARSFAPAKREFLDFKKRYSNI